MKLYELSTYYAQLVDKLETADSDSSEVIRDTLAAIDETIELKAESIAKILQQKQSETIAIEAEIERLSKRKEVIKNQHDTLKEYLKTEMLQMGKEKFKSDIFSFSIRNNNPSVQFTDESIVPAEFKTEVVTIKIDKKAISERLKDGELIEGCQLVQSKSLIIK